MRVLPIVRNTHFTRYDLPLKERLTQTLDED